MNQHQEVVLCQWFNGYAFCYSGSPHSCCSNTENVLQLDSLQLYWYHNSAWSQSDCSAQSWILNQQPAPEWWQGGFFAVHSDDRSQPGRAACEHHRPSTAADGSALFVACYWICFCCLPSSVQSHQPCFRACCSLSCCRSISQTHWSCYS